MDQYGLYIDLCLLVCRTTTDNYFVYDSCCTTMGGDSGDIYCVTFIDNRTYAPMIILKKGTRWQLRNNKTNRWLFWWRNWNAYNLEYDEIIIAQSIII